jgi:stage III sporulation protein AG
MTDRIKKIFDSGKLRKIIIICGIAGIALIFLSNYINPVSRGNERTDVVSTEEYGKRVESDLETLITHIQGVGAAKVMLTMENSVENVYLKDSTTKTKEVEPVIRGVLVVCEGGDDPVVVERVTQAVTKALDISAAKVCITKLSE